MTCECHTTSMIVVRESSSPAVRWCWKCGTLFAFNLWRVRDSHAEKCTHPAGSIKRGARWEWCECCGAVRLHKERKPSTYWLKPGGPYGRNPGDLKPLPPKRKKPVEAD